MSHVIFIFQGWVDNFNGPTGLLAAVSILFSIITDKPLHNPDMVSVHFINFPCIEICNTLRKQLSMLTYNDPRFKLQISVNYVESKKMISEHVFSFKAFKSTVSV